jgi:hypothetical protein
LRIIGIKFLTKKKGRTRMPIPEHIIIPAGKDPGRGHFYVSLVKSFVRIAGFAFLMAGNFWIAGLLLIGAEGLGVVEELV